MEDEETEVYEVREITASRKRTGHPVEYHVKWVGFPDPSWDTWGPIENLRGTAPASSLSRQASKWYEEEKVEEEVVVSLVYLRKLNINCK